MQINQSQFLRQGVDLDEDFFEPCAWFSFHPRADSTTLYLFCVDLGIINPLQKEEIEMNFLTQNLPTLIQVNQYQQEC